MIRTRNVPNHPLSYFVLVISAPVVSLQSSVSTVTSLLGLQREPGIVFVSSMSQFRLGDGFVVGTVMAGKSGPHGSGGSPEPTLCFQLRVDCWQSGPVSSARSQVSCLHVLRSISSLGTSAVCLTPDYIKPPAPAFLSLCPSQGTIVYTSLAQKVVPDSLSC